ncbi:hydrolase [Parasporobacterium paucivorans]|uniref:Nicotinamidase-related amidase n=1 Tax=Parasporobacterium paucivorans DSM 15970 TaxID=1122934 RepID=A0A1M6HMH3_9FIRM|nr:hydrolase [Parasporobacterium paucivorans]SHJ23388.1 Nicotinamidase-related amidase [Parasporobacterium paucivorans DSM 15970]
MKINFDDSAMLVIDIQEKLLPAMYAMEEMFENSLTLIRGAAQLKLPTIITQQYPKGLGFTQKEVTDLLPDSKIFDKMSFSCMTPEVAGELKEMGRKNIIICGIESHVCVLQTVMDLVKNGYQPVLVADCVSSRKKSDLKFALRRAQAEGAIITTYESVLFELIDSAKHPEFKEISKIIK